MSGRHALSKTARMSHLPKTHCWNLKLSTVLIETFMRGKVKETPECAILFALSAFFAQNNRVLSIQKTRNNSKRGT